MSIRFLNYLFLLIQKLHLQMIQVLLNNLIGAIRPNSYILLNIQIPSAQFMRFSYSLAYSQSSRAGLPEARKRQVCAVNSG